MSTVGMEAKKKHENWCDLPKMKDKLTIRLTHTCENINIFHIKYNWKVHSQSEPKMNKIGFFPWI